MKTYRISIPKDFSWKSVFIVIMTVGSFGLTSCSSSQKAADAELDQRVKAQPEASTPAEIAKRAADTFANAPNLSEDQKARLRAIYLRVSTEAAEIRKEIGQSKSLMFQLVAKKDFKSSDVQRLKSKIVDLDLKRLQIMFKALEEVQAVVGFGSDREELYRHLRDYEFPYNQGILSKK